MINAQRGGLLGFTIRTNNQTIGRLDETYWDEWNLLVDLIIIFTWFLLDDDNELYKIVVRVLSYNLNFEIEMTFLIWDFRISMKERIGVELHLNPSMMCRNIPIQHARCGYSVRGWLEKVLHLVLRKRWTLKHARFIQMTEKFKA